MASNTIIGTPEWNAWFDAIKRTGKLYVKAYTPPQVILDERDELKGLLVLRKELEATEEVGNKARPGQILFWYGDYAPEVHAANPGIWNGYDVKRNVYIVEPANAELFTQAELDVDPESTLRRLESAASGVFNEST